MRKLRVVQIGSLDVSIFLVTRKELEALVPTKKDECLYGYSDPLNGKIYLVDEGHITSLEDTYLHEIIHVLMEVSGLRGVFRALAKSESDAETLEESVVRGLAPVLLRTLKNAGFKTPSLRGRK